MNWREIINGVEIKAVDVAETAKDALSILRVDIQPNRLSFRFLKLKVTSTQLVITHLQKVQMANTLSVQK
jgi:hypothetical protein